MEVFATMTVRLPLIKPDGHWCEILLRNYQYLPAARCSLIALSELEEPPLNFDWKRAEDKSGIILMSEDGRDMGFTEIQDGLFHHLI